MALKSLFIFDFDGVFANTLDFYYGFHKLIAPKYGLPSAKRFFLDVLRKDVMASLLDTGISQGMAVKYRHEVKLQLIRNVQDIKCYPFSKDFIFELSKTQPVLIVSHNDKAVISRVLQQLGVRDKVKEILGNEVDPRKAVKLLRLKNKYKADSYFFVGDSPSDIISAKHVQMKSIAVSWGYFKKKDLLECNPDVLLTNPKQLSNFIKLH